MHFILDGIVVIIVLIVAYFSAKKGFVKTLVETIGFVAAIIIAFTISSPLADIVYDKMIEPSIIETVNTTVSDGTDSAEKAVDAVWNKMPNFITDNSFFNLSKSDITESVKTDTQEGDTALAQNISNIFVYPVIIKILSVVFSVILVVALLFLVKILAKFLNKIFSFSVIGVINKFLGGVLGIFKGILLATVFCLLISLILSFTKNGFLIFNYATINASYIFKILMGFSPFL